MKMKRRRGAVRNTKGLADSIPRFGSLSQLVRALVPTFFCSLAADHLGQITHGGNGSGVVEHGLQKTRGKLTDPGILPPWNWYRLLHLYGMQSGLATYCTALSESWNMRQSLRAFVSCRKLSSSPHVLGYMLRSIARDLQPKFPAPTTAAFTIGVQFDDTF